MVIFDPDTVTPYEIYCELLRYFLKYIGLLVSLLLITTPLGLRAGKPLNGFNS